jgi:aminoglycoside 3-N-acetyltransferase I
MDNIRITKLKPGDENKLKQLLDLYIEVFGEPDYPKSLDYLPALLQRPTVIFIIAEEGDEVIGGLTAHVLPSVYGDYSEIYMYDLAVTKKHQRHGVGSKLLASLKDFGKSSGVTEVFVQADTPDTEARNFYIKNGGIEEDVRHYGFPV